MKTEIVSLLVLQLILMVFTPSVLTAQKDVANYEMKIFLDDDEKKVNGETKLSWTNISEVPVSELQFHLYFNAFKNNHSTFFSENNNRMDFLGQGNDCNWGWSQINSFSDEAGRSLTMTYIQPDDENIEDRTVIKVDLQEAINPGETKTFDFKWQAKIPRIMPRTGYNKDFIFMAQWFPKVGVFEPAGMRGRDQAGWNCHQYHSSGEYYANFGDYTVSVDLPSAYKFGSSGILLDVQEKGNRKIWTAEAKDVIDFTWTASPHFLEIKDSWKNVELSLFCYPEHEDYAERYFTAIKNSMEFLTEHVGEYPYPKLTIVDVPLHGLFTGGMEYPMLVSSFGVCFMPKGIRVTEILVIHEFIHQYFMQMVATNETEDPWMDEGLTTYYECRIVDKYYGEHNSAIDFLGITSGNFEYNRYELLNSKDYKVAPGKYASWEFPGRSYGNVAYNKMASVLKTLEQEIGLEDFDACMKKYFETWKFKHPAPQDFVDVFNDYSKEHLGEKYPNGLDWFFDQALFSDGYCDYLISGFDNYNPVDKSGVFDGSEECLTEASEEIQIISEINVKRNGNIKIPIELLLQFADGSSKTLLWDAQKAEDKIILRGNTELISVELDPNNRNDLDINLLNNGLRTQKNSVTASKYGVKVQSILQLIFEAMSSLL